MAKWILNSSGSSSSSAGALNPTPHGGIDGVSTTAAAETEFFGSYTIDDMRWYITSLPGGNATGYGIKNGSSANSNLTVSITGTGEFQDTSNSDSIVSGDDHNLGLNVAGGMHGDDVTAVSWQVTIDAATDIPMAVTARSDGWAFQGGTVFYKPIEAGATETTTEANHETTMDEARTFDNMRLYVSTASGDTATMRLREDRGNSAIVISSSGSGRLADTTNSEAVAVNSEVNYSMTNPDMMDDTVINQWQIDYDTSTRILGFFPAPLSGTTHFTKDGQDATEANAEIEAADAATIQNLRCYVVQYSDNRTVASRKNQAAGSLTVSITGTGLVSDTTNSDTLADTDDWVLRQTGGSSGSHQYHAYVEWETASGTNATITGVVASADAAGVAGTVASVGIVNVTGVAASANSAGIAGTVEALEIVNASVTGAVATADAAGVPGTVASEVTAAVTGAVATTTAAGAAGTVEAIVVVSTNITGAVASADAAGVSGNIQSLVSTNITGVVAAADSAGVAGTVTSIGIVAITGVVASADAAGVPGVLTTPDNKTITGVVASATAAGGPGTVDAVVLNSASITGVVAAADAAGIAGTVVSVGIVNVTGVVAAAPAAGVAGAVESQIPTTVTGVVATATADGVAGTVESQISTNITGAAATADAAGIPGTVDTGTTANITGVVASADAAAVAGAVATIRIVTITGVVADATAAGVAGTVESQVTTAVSGVVATADAAGVAGTVTSVGIVDVSGVVATATAAGVAGTVTAVAGGISVPIAYHHHARSWRKG